MNILQNEILQLRAVEPDDAQTIFDWENDVELWASSSTREPFSRFSIEQFLLNYDKNIYQNQQLRLMIEEKKTKFSVGCIDFFNFEPAHLRAEIGLLIDKNFQGRGFAYFAVELLENYAFQMLHLHQIYCHISAENSACLRVFEKRNFKNVATLKDWILLPGGKFQNVILFTKTKE